MFLIAIRSDVPGADTWRAITRTHSRDVLLHQQYLTGTYWRRHNLNPPDIPLRQRATITRIEKTGISTNASPWVTLRDALANVPDPLDNDDIEGWPNHRAILGARTYAKHTGSPMDMPSKTIKAGVHGVSGGEAMLRQLDGTVRYLTVREAALVQGFPNDYEFPGYRSRVMGVIGNAVSVARCPNHRNRAKETHRLVVSKASERMSRRFGRARPQFPLCQCPGPADRLWVVIRVALGQ